MKKVADTEASDYQKKMQDIEERMKKAEEQRLAIKKDLEREMLLKGEMRKLQEEQVKFERLR